MSLSSHALFVCLQSDLSKELPTLGFHDLSPANNRDKAWPGISAREFACLSLADSLLKKFQDELDPDCDERALTKFLEFNRRCKVNSTVDVTGLTEIEAIAVGEAKSIFYDFWFRPGGDYILNVDNISAHMAVGPGASVGVSGNSFYEKLGASPLTGTRKSLYSLYLREASKYPLWLETEKIRSGRYGGFTEVSGSRLSFVPKTREISRTICTEPLLNMLLQKGIGAVMEHQLIARFGISLAVQQDRNRSLARLGSQNDTYGTIDLSNASDSIGLELLRTLVPKYIMSWLEEARSPMVRLPDGSSCELQMVSSMGNAFTFPLQTILFSSIVQGVYSALNIESRKPSHARPNWGVFGDDIIVEPKAYDLTVAILRRFGFVVNASKSFGEGPFRESCGADFWLGENVRGIYCNSLKTKHDIYSLINRLNVWSANTGILLSNTIRYLIKASGVEILPIPPWDADDAGLKVPLSLIPFIEMKRKRDTGSILYQRYAPKPSQISLLNVEQRPVRRAGWFNNHPGILLAAISGHLRSGAIVERVNKPHYKKRLATAPCWDWIDPCYSTLTSSGWQRWKSFVVSLNLEAVQLSVRQDRYNLP